LLPPSHVSSCRRHFVDQRVAHLFAIIRIEIVERRFGRDLRGRLLNARLPRHKDCRADSPWLATRDATSSADNSLEDWRSSGAKAAISCNAIAVRKLPTTRSMRPLSAQKRKSCDFSKGGALCLATMVRVHFFRSHSGSVAALNILALLFMIDPDSPLLILEMMGRS
jgi:hypothetical protein